MPRFLLLQLQVAAGAGGATALAPLLLNCIGKSCMTAANAVESQGKRARLADPGSAPDLAWWDDRVAAKVSG